MSLDFPSSPVNGQEYMNPQSNVVYTYNSTYNLWEIRSTAGVAGSNTHIQFNASRSFGSSPSLTFDYASYILNVNGTANVNGTVVLKSLNANGSVGSNGNVLYSNGSVSYWDSLPPPGGYYKGASSTVGTLAVHGQNIFRVNANTLSYNTTIAAGENAQAVGPLSVSSGVTLVVDSGARVSIV